jgi:zinc protease
MPHAPMAYLAAHSRVGTLGSPPGKEGIVELAAMLAVRGAGDLPAADFGRAVKDLGGDFNAEPESLGTFITLSVPSENLGAAITLLGDVLRRPRFDPAEWDVAKAETLNDLAVREGNLAEVAGRYGEAALFPRRPGQAAIDRSLASVRGITRAQVVAAFPRIFSPSTVSFVSVGSTPLVDVAAALEAEFGSWRPAAEPFPAGPRERTTFPAGRRALVVPEPGAAQVALYVALPAPGPREPEYPQAVAVHRLLNLDFISRINSVIREELAFTYGTDGELFADVHEGSALTIEAPVDREVAGAALDEIFAAIASLAAEPVRDDELQRTVTAYYAAMAATAETAGGLFDAICKQLGNGSSLEEAHARRLAVTALELEAVRDRAVAMASLDRVLVVAVGDPDIIVPQLEAIGLEPELVERNL